MKLSGRASAVSARDDDKNDGGRDWTCFTCEQWCKGSWSHCSTCHLTFASLRDFDKHRIGRFENRATGQENTRRCLAPDELQAGHWTRHDDNLWRSPEKIREDT